MKDRQQSATWATAVMRGRSFAWLVIVIADVGLLAWGATAVLAPERLPGPGSVPILWAGYEGFSKHSWSELNGTSPMTAQFMTLIFRLYGAYIVAVALLAIAIAATAFRRGEGWAWWSLLVGNTIAFGAAMSYDWIVGAIGPLEMSEYVGIASIYGALAVTTPFLAGRRSSRCGQ